MASASRKHIIFLLFSNVMVIRHDHRHPQFFGPLHLTDGGNSIVTGQNGIDSIVGSRLHDLDIDAITVLDPVRNS